MNYIRSRTDSFGYKRIAAIEHESENIIATPNHRCSSLLPDPINYTYNLRTNNAYGWLAIYLGTRRDKRTFIPHAYKHL